MISKSNGSQTEEDEEEDNFDDESRDVFNFDNKISYQMVKQESTGSISTRVT
jgi:hypothetical protein